ncbi:MAG: DUF1048 domain-containing protein [Sarcina sp.]
MNFLDRVTGNDITREFKGFEERAIKLPEEYQLAWEKIKKNIWKYSDFTGRNLMPFFENAITFLEETADEEVTVEEALGNDIEGFCFELIGKENSNSFKDKCGRKLNKNIEKKLSK